MSWEVARRYCPYCKKEVEAFRQRPESLAWFLLFGWFGLVVCPQHRWRCRQCAKAIPLTASERRWRTLKVGVAMILLLLAVAAVAAHVYRALNQ